MSIGIPIDWVKTRFPKEKWHSEIKKRTDTFKDCFENELFFSLLQYALFPETFMYFFRPPEKAKSIILNKINKRDMRNLCVESCKIKRWNMFYIAFGVSAMDFIKKRCWILYYPKIVVVKIEIALIVKISGLSKQ